MRVWILVILCCFFASAVDTSIVRREALLQEYVKAVGSERSKQSESEWQVPSTATEGTGIAGSASGSATTVLPATIAPAGPSATTAAVTATAAVTTASPATTAISAATTAVAMTGPKTVKEARQKTKEEKDDEEDEGTKKADNKDQNKDQQASPPQNWIFALAAVVLAAGGVYVCFRRPEQKLKDLQEKPRASILSKRSSADEKGEKPRRREASSSDSERHRARRSRTEASAPVTRGNAGKTAKEGDEKSKAGKSAAESAGDMDPAEGGETVRQGAYKARKQVAPPGPNADGIQEPQTSAKPGYKNRKQQPPAAVVSPGASPTGGAQDEKPPDSKQEVRPSAYRSRKQLQPETDNIT